VNKDYRQWRKTCASLHHCEIGENVVFLVSQLFVAAKTIELTAVPLITSTSDVWGRLAETGSGNKSQLVAFQSTRLEQRPACCIVFLHC